MYNIDFVLYIIVCFIYEIKIKIDIFKGVRKMLNKNYINLDQFFILIKLLL